MLMGEDASMLDQLRRLCRAAGVEPSINDSAADLRKKLLCGAPTGLAETLHSSMKRPTAMFREPSNPRAGSQHEAHSAPTTPRRPSNSSAFMTTVPPTAPVRTVAPSFAYLGQSGRAVRSAAGYLLEPGAPAPEAKPPEQSAVLARVMASAERLELEFAHAAAVATSDAAKAVESARLEALKAHVRGLRQLQVPTRTLLKLAALRRHLALAPRLDLAPHAPREARRGWVGLTLLVMSCVRRSGTACSCSASPRRTRPRSPGSSRPRG